MNPPRASTTRAAAWLAERWEHLRANFPTLTPATYHGFLLEVSSSWKYPTEWRQAARRILKFLPRDRWPRHGGPA